MMTIRVVLAVYLLTGKIIQAEFEIIIYFLNKYNALCKHLINLFIEIKN